jgi:protein SCO1/2
MKRLGLLFFLLAGFLVGGLAAFWLSGAPQQNTGEVQSTGKALVGGPFELVNHDGQPVTNQDFRGRLMLVFFGFTHCPDICPTELQTMAVALNQLGKDADKIAPLFITLDPERDTPEQIKSYVQSFDNRFIGLTGTREQIDKVAKAYRVYHRKAKPSDEADASNYTIDHSAFVYLIDGKGEYITHFSFGVPPDKMVEGIRRSLQSSQVKLTLG